MPSTSKEDIIVLALKAFKRDAILKVNTAAKIYGVDRMILTRRRDGCNGCGAAGETMAIG